MCEKLGLDFERVKDMVLADSRIAKSHTDCPGHSGFGVSGSCLPKDLQAMINFSKDIGLDPKLFEAAWGQNLEDRPDKDWEQIPGVLTKKQ